MKLTVESIQNAITASPYKTDCKYKTYFHLNKESLAIVEAATSKGYIIRLSHTQAQWTEEGLAKAREELFENNIVSGIIVTVLRLAGTDCTNNGLSMQADRLYLVGPMIKGNIEVDVQSDQFLSVGSVTFLNKTSYHAKPVNYGHETKRFMAGGNYCVGDSYFKELFGGPISIHDRQE